MASRGRERIGRPRGSSRPSHGFDEQAFVAAMRAATTAIAQASATRGPSNLQWFITHHSLTFTGGKDPVVADHWFRQVEGIFEAMEITSNATRIRLATFSTRG